MKRIVFYLTLFFITTSLFSQTYTVDFESSSVDNTLDSILITNISSNDTLKIESNVQLILTDGISGIEEDVLDLKQNIYPNPSYGELMIESNISSQQTNISIVDLSGRIVYREKLKATSADKITISNIPKGIYVLTVASSANQSSKLIISQSQINSWSGVTTSYLSTAKTYTSNSGSKSNLKSSLKKDTTMLYNEGERLLLTGYTGSMQAVISIIPTKDTTISFNFYECSDGDNNNYKVVEIGEQIWMAENLKTTHYNNGNEIYNETDAIEWTDLLTGAYCWYDNNEAKYKADYGALYNWYAVATDSLCPTGWHVPTDDEWTNLTTYLGGIGEAGKLKEIGTTHWSSPNSGATNETGFTALPGGCRDGVNGRSFYISTSGLWWSSTMRYASIATYRYMEYNRSYMSTHKSAMSSGMSVRCLRD